MTVAAGTNRSTAAAAGMTVVEEQTLFSPSLWWGIARRRWPIWVSLAIALSLFMGLRDARKAPNYSGSFRMLVQPLIPPQSLGKLTDEKSGSSAPPEFDYSTQIEVLLSPQVLKPVVQRLERLYPGTRLETIAGQLKVERLGETKILEVSFSDANPGLVRNALQELASRYLKVGREQQRSDVQRGLEFVNRELPKVRRQVSTLQLQIRSLQQQYDFTDLAGYSSRLGSQLSSIQAQRNQLQLKQLDLRSQILGVQREAALLNQLADRALPVQELQSLRQEIARESARLGPKNPRIQLLKRQERNLLPVLKADRQQQQQLALVKLQNELRSVVVQDQLLQRQELLLQTRSRQLPQLQERITALQRNLDIADSSLKRFLESQQQLSILNAQTDAPWQLTTPPGEPQASPAGNLVRSLISGAVMGAIAGLLLGYLLERFRNTCFTLEDLKRSCPEPILAAIPLNRELEASGTNGYVVDLRAEALTDDSSNYWLEAYDAYGFFEAFRSLYAQLHHDAAGQVVRSLALSSSQPLEGTSTVAIHLAQAAAALGRRVVLVDAHLRRGGTPLHQLLDLPNPVGLSAWLQQQAGIEEIIQHLHWESDLGVITAGPLPHDPSRLLASGRMQELMRQLGDRYDLVIVDLPPMNHLADVKLISRLVDGVAVVHSLGRAGNAATLRESLAWLRTSPVPLLGVIVNRVPGMRVDPYARPA